MTHHPRPSSALHVCARAPAPTSASRSPSLIYTQLDLDEIFWEREAKTFGPQTALPRSATWIVEGAYVGSWLLPSFTAADAVIALRPAVWVRDWRYSTRWLQRKLGLRPQQQNKRETLEGLWELYRYNHRYDRSNIPEAKALLAGLGRQLIAVRTREPLLKYVTA
jgi:hypothetical protein